MGDFLIVGGLLGAAIGFVHAIQMFRQRLADTGGDRANALWFALWTIVLWTLGGAYVLAFWIIGAAGMAVAGLAARSGAAR